MLYSTRVLINVAYCSTCSSAIFSAKTRQYQHEKITSVFCEGRILKSGALESIAFTSKSSAMRKKLFQRPILGDR